MPFKNKEDERRYNREYRERNKEKLKKYIDDWRMKNPDHSKGNYAKYIAKNPNYYKMRNLKKYGLTMQQYNDMLWNQNYKCALCKTADHNGKGWHVDHCHKTEKVRGLLCNNCNVGLGHFKEDVELFKEAINYLEGKL